MIIKVTKEVNVEISDKDIQEFRTKFGTVANRGILSKDSMIAFVLASDKAVDLVARLDGSVKTSTSIDNELSENINKF